MSVSIEELEYSNKFLRQQIDDKQRLIASLESALKKCIIPDQEVQGIPKIPGIKNIKENIEVLNVVRANKEFDSMKLLDEIRVLKCSMKEIQASIESERKEFLNSIHETRNSLLEKDIEIGKLQDALEKACARSVALEDEVAKLKARSSVSVNPSPAISSSAPGPRISIVSSTGSTADHSALFSRSSFTGTNGGLSLPTMTSLQPHRLSGSGFGPINVQNATTMTFSPQQTFTFHGMNR